jgi:uncharacterized protein (DUF2126 family)
MANALSLTGNRFCDALVAWPEAVEQIAIGIEIAFGEQAVHRVFVRLEPAVMQNVCNVNTAPVEFVSDKKRAVAVKRLLFGTHQHYPVLLSALLDSQQSVVKARRAGEAIVSDMALFVARSIA